MEKKKFILILILLALPMLAQAAITCTAEAAANCSSGEEVLQLSDGITFTNSHGAIPNWSDTTYTTGYPAKICCTEITSATCGTGPAKIMLRLSGSTNAHAEGPAETTAGYADVCINASPQITSITLRNGACNTGETCIVALSDVTNAHLAQCSDADYPQKICASQSAGSLSKLIIEKIVVPDPAYKGQPLNVVVTVAKASAGTEEKPGTEIIKLESSNADGKILKLAVEGSVRVSFVNPPAGFANTPKTVPIDIPAGQQRADATATYPSSELDSLNPGIYTLLIEVLDNDSTVVASQTVNFALANPPNTASIPETNWLGAIIVAACVFTIVFVAQRKSRNTSN